MKQIEKDKLYYYCYGCTRLEREQFEGVRNCKDFVGAVEDWQNQLREELKKK